MSRISISTAKYLQLESKEVEIDGVEYTVFKPGAGFQLDMATLSREMFRLQRLFEKANEKDRVELMGQILDNTDKIKNLYITLFDDGTDNHQKSKELVRKIGMEKIPNMLNDIFEESE